MVSTETTYQPRNEQKEGKGTAMRVALRRSALHEGQAAVVWGREAPLRRGGGEIASQTHVPIRNQARGQR